MHLVWSVRWLRGFLNSSDYQSDLKHKTIRILIFKSDCSPPELQPASDYKKNTHRQADVVTFWKMWGAALQLVHFITPCRYACMPELWPLSPLMETLGAWSSSQCLIRTWFCPICPNRICLGCWREEGVSNTQTGSCSLQQRFQYSDWKWFIQLPNISLNQCLSTICSLYKEPHLFQ